MNLQLSKMVMIMGVTIELVRPSPDLSNAPCNIVVWDTNESTQLMNLTYSIATPSPSVQTFPRPSSTTISNLRLEISSNWGHTEYSDRTRQLCGGDVICDSSENYL